MNKNIFTAVLILCLAVPAFAGEIAPGATPGSINYQGRLERDNAPITGRIHLFFRIYNAASGGTLRWTSPELEVDAAQGIFSASITPGWDIFSRAETLYLEVQVESEVLAPREPLNSVAYAIVAKKLEDGASVSVTTFSAAYQVLLATVAGSNVGIGTLTPTNKLTVNGSLQLLPGGSIIFPDSSVMTAAGIGSASNVSAFDDATIIYDSDNNFTGDLIFSNPAGERARILNNGRMGIGTAAPGGQLDVDGSLYVGTEGIYDRDDGEINVKENLIVEGGRVTGANAEYMTLGETNNVIALHSGGSERLRVHTDGNVGINTAAPAWRLDVAGDIHTNTGLLASAVSAGAYSGWTSAANEVRAANATHLLLQQNNPYNVGVGTDTPREKLHVRGSMRSDYGVIAATGAFSSNVSVNGDFTANGANKSVYLTSTTIYGTLTVTGGIGSTAGFPAYLTSTQTFTGQNTFANQVQVSSDILTPARLGAALIDFDFPGGRYLQVGDNKPEYSAQNTYAYLVGGDSANSRLAFYRGAAEAGSLGSHNGVNLGMIIAGSTKTLADSTYYRIQNSVVWISTAYNTTPAIYVSSQAGNVGIGTSVSDSTYKLTVNGSLRIAGATSNAIVFADGSTMNTAATIGTAMGISNSGDAIVAANTLGGGGSVVLRSGSVDGLAVDSGGNVGVGTLNPVSKFNVRGGDLVLGTPFNPYSSNGVEDLLVGGSVIFDGALIQRSASAAQFSGLIVAGDVFLSTGTGKKTGVATSAPYTTFDVNGNAQFGLGTAKSTFTAAGALQLAVPLGTVSGGTGNATGNAPTASALAANGGNCAAGTAPLGVDAAGAAEACFDIANQDELNTHTLATSTHGATNLNTANRIVLRDGSGNFSAGTISANLSGNATTATDLAANGGNCGAGNAPLGVDTGGAVESCFDVATQGELDTHAGASSVHNATNLNTANRIVLRDGLGSFSAGTISANLSGNATTATNLAANGGDCSAGNAPLGVDTAGAAESCFDVATQGELDTHTGATAAHSATSTNTNSRIVMRDGSGNFSAGTISANLTGDVTGNASTASAMANNGASGKVVCWRASGVLGQCSDAPTASGCTCVATP
ncbi:MAG: hypothetical protein NDI60_10730 [Elusimicrobiales bacterium]|nr:hypothetical protein [Elusimicrobiales bacterium]